MANLKKQTWRKLHIGMDPETQEIIVANLTLNSQGNVEVGVQLIKQVHNTVKKV